MFSLPCDEFGASKEAPPELAPQLVGARPTAHRRPRASHPADSLLSRSAQSGWLFELKCIPHKSVWDGL